MIKQFIYISAALAISATLAGCTENDEPAIKADPARYITFARPTIDIEATVGNFDSRAVDSRAALGESFKVWGFCQARDANDELSESSIGQPWNEKANFFTQGADVAKLQGDIVSLVDDGTTYNGGNLTKWIQDGDPQYTFIAVAGLGNNDSQMDNSSMSTGDAHGPRLTITLPITLNNIATSRDYASQPDAKIAYLFDKGPADSPIELKFMHIMTGIRFKFQNLSTTGLRIIGVTYAGRFYKQAIVKFDSNKPVMTVNTAQTYACTFNLFNGQQDIPSNSAEYMGGADPVTLMLLPNPAGTIADDGRYTLGTEKLIAITYQRQADNGQWGNEKTFTLEDFTLSYIPKPNTLHTATFSFVGDGFITTFQADNQENWENGSDSNITIH